MTTTITDLVGLFAFIFAPVWIWALVNRWRNL